MEVDGKSSEGKEKLPIKRSRGSVGSLNLTSGKNNEPEKPIVVPENGAYSKRYGRFKEPLNCNSIYSSGSSI